MARNILILGASYGSLLGTKLLMAGQDVTLVCRQATADLINAKGTETRIKLRGEPEHRAIRSGDLPGALTAKTPQQVDVSEYDMVALAMSEPQCGSEEIRALLDQIASARVPCLSIMNMPPLAYLRRIPGLDIEALREAFNCPDVWAGFEPGLVSLCSPDPQAFRPPGEGANVLHVGLPTNFKAAPFEREEHNAMLQELAEAIDAVQLDGNDVPVKLRVFDSLFVPFAKWAMLMTGNYRCVLQDGAQSIRDAVHSDIVTSKRLYDLVCDLTIYLGAAPGDLVPFEKYANAAHNLLKPSSAARAIEAGASQIERVDLLVTLLAEQAGMGDAALHAVSETTSARLALNQRVAA